MQMRRPLALALLGIFVSLCNGIDLGGGDCCATNPPDCAPGQFCVASAICSPWDACCTSCCCELPASMSYDTSGGCEEGCGSEETCVQGADGSSACMSKLDLTPANPHIPFFGYGAIVPDSNPIIAGDVTNIAVTVGNDGGADAKGVEVVLSYYPWGVSFSAWYEIGTVVTDIDSQTQEVLSFSNIFETQAHTCLQAQIVDVGQGGNLFINDDRGQINTEVVYSDDDGSVDVPIMNGLDEPIYLDKVEVKCRKEVGTLSTDTYTICRCSHLRRRGNGVDDNCDGEDDDCNLFAVCDPDTTPPTIDAGDDLATDGGYLDIYNQCRAPGANPKLRKELQCDGRDNDCDGVCDGLDNDCDGAPDVDDCPKLLGVRLDTPEFRDADSDDDGIIDGAYIVIPPQSQVTVRVSADLSAVRGALDLVVHATAFNGTESQHAMLQLVHTTPEELLNLAQLCCIKSVRVRVSLENLIAAALAASENGDASKALRLLRLFIQRAQELLCDLSPEEKRCVQQAIRRVLDAIRMLARAGTVKGRESFIAEADELRRAGYTEAAGVEYHRAAETEMLSLSLTADAAKFWRTGRNPQTGKEIKIAAKNVVRFKAGADLSGKVN